MIHSECHKLFFTDAKLTDEPGQISPDQGNIKNFVASRYRCMCGKYCIGCYQFKRDRKLHALGNQTTTALDDLQTRVSFIDMPHTGNYPQTGQYPYTTNSKDDFLFNAHVLIAGINLISDGSIRLTVRIDISIEQIKVGMTSLYPPDLG